MNINDDTLVLYYYDDGLSADERAAVAAALGSDAGLAERYRALCRSLERLDSPPVQARPHAVARWHRSIERAAAGENASARGAGKGWHFPSFAWGALAAAVVLALAVRLWFPEEAVPVMPAPGDEMVAGDHSPVLRAVPVSFSRGLELHLRDSRQELVRLAAEGNGDRRLLLDDIIRQNRQFQRAALENNAEELARVLRAFEPILVRLADEDLSEEDAAMLKAKLVFELDVMLTKMSARESHDAQTI